MPISFLTSLSSLAVRRYLNEASNQSSRAMERMASGSRLTRFHEDPAGHALADRLQIRIRSGQQAMRNTVDALSLLQVTGGAMNECSNLLLRLRELSVQAANEAIGDEERELLAIEAHELGQEFDRLTQTTRYLGTDLLNGNGRDFDFQIGLEAGEADRITYYGSNIDLSPGTLGIDELDLTDADEAQDALEIIDAATFSVEKARSEVGAVQSRLEHGLRHLTGYTDYLTEAHSRMSAADMGAEAATFAASQIRQKAALALLAQANQIPEATLELLKNPNR